MNCLPIWDQTMDPLSSIIPPPTAPPLAAAMSKEISSFMDIPLNSMHANHLMLFPADPGLTERAARYSCFNSSNYGALSVQFGVSEAPKLSRGSSSQCFQAKERSAQTRAPSEMGDVELGSGLEDSSVTDPVSATGERNVKMRKATPKRKGKVATENDLNAKKYRSVETTGHVKDDVEPKEDQNGCKSHAKDNGPKDPEPPKDYIHVRARRGQATDSHSLAERVRREKISQRMKLLQDLVPGCNKITGKALMLDEIINYVQSLQRQVEFLSMKLATSTPLVDFKLNSFITKESLLNQENAFMPNSLYNLDNLAGAYSFGQLLKEADPLDFNVANTMETHGTMSKLESTFHQTAGIQSFLDIFGNSASQVGDPWDDELRSVIRMGFGQNPEIGHTFDSFREQLPISHMKLEL